MFSAVLFSELESVLSQHTGSKLLIKKTEPVGGGCINRATKISTDAGDFFVKVNDAARYPQMFEAEAKGLQLLTSTKAIKIPVVIACGEAGGESFIVLEFIEPSSRNKSYWENFGRALANLHGNTAKQFGLDNDNYIGSLPQSNKKWSDWTSFFIHERLQKQVHLASKKQLLASKHLHQFEKLYPHLNEFFPKEQPALLHGDLWSGNFITGADGEACMIDPAVYYGHREMELAFTGLFGGFDARFYAAYREAFPLQPGFEERKDVYNLYPLLVHLNLFGGGYLASVEGILSSLFE